MLLLLLLLLLLLKTPTLDFTRKFLCLLARGFGFFILILSLTFSALLYMVSANGLDGEYLIYKPRRFYPKGLKH
jgi:hypothetical protein